MNQFKVSRFTLVEQVNDNLVGLFNALTRSLVLAPTEYWQNINSHGDSDLPEEFIDQGFLVNKSIDEDLVLAHWRASQAYDVTNLVYIISPTHACNMACSYCVHGQRKRAEHMTMDTARMVSDFIINDIEQKLPLSVTMDFGGAEALLNPRVIKHLSETAGGLCKVKNIEFKTSLITNGLSLSPELADSLLPHGLYRIRVTISGPANIHDKYRITRDRKPTYSRIMDNLVKMAGRTSIGLAGQYDPSNGDHLKWPEMLDDLKSYGLDEHINDISFGPIIALNGSEHASGNGQESDKTPGACPIGCLQDEEPGRIIWLQDQVLKRGFKVEYGTPSNTCLANYRNSMVIDVNGAIKACPSMIDYPENEYGHVCRGIDFRLEAMMLARELPEECRRHCAMAPLCDGGCRHQALERTGDFSSVNCLRKTYEHLTRAYIRREALMAAEN